MEIKFEKIGLVILLSFVLISSLSFASTSVHTRMDIENGSAVIKQTVNGQTIEIQTNDGVDIFTNVTDSEVKTSVQAKGTGTLETEINSGEYEIDANIDEEQESYSGEGMFSKIFNFFDSLIFRMISFK